MHRLARSGTPVDAPAVEVEVGRLDLAPTERAGIYSFVAEVSAGTYIRALIRDLGSRLGCGGVLAALRRESIGPMSLDRAVAGGDDLERTILLDALVPLEEMPLVPPPLRLDGSADAWRFMAGAAVAVGTPTVGIVRVLDPTGVLLGVGEVRGGLVWPRVVVSGRTG
jgi:tRNA pseudouridine55 synthase